MKCFLKTIIAMAFLTSGCSPKQEAPKSSLLDPNGQFFLYVSNQSFAVTPVDIRVEIDGEIVVADNFNVGSQHNWKKFTLTLSPGKHTVRAYSKKGEAEISKEFEVKGKHWAVIDYCSSPESHSRPASKGFGFFIDDKRIGFE